MLRHHQFLITFISMLTERPWQIELATNKTVQETQLSLTNRATHLCKRNDVADLLKQGRLLHINDGANASCMEKVGEAFWQKLRGEVH